MTFNLRYDNPRDAGNRWARRRDSVVRLIQDRRPDVLGCQEALPHQRRQLSERLGADYESLGTGRDEGGGGEQSPLFYRPDRLELRDSETFWLSPDPQRSGSRGWDATLPRICTLARFRIGKSTLLVGNVHLDHQGRQSRAQAAEILLDRFSPNTPCVLMGDFNAQEKEAPIRRLSERFQDSFRQANPRATAREAGTFHAFLGWFFPFSSRIDYIFADRGATVLNAEILREPGTHGGYPSDHYPVRARLRW